MPTFGFADRPCGPPGATRSVVMATHGLAATSQPLAALVAVDILKRGGNAVDAAIAANAVLGVVEPMSCGIGGDLFAIVWDARSDSLHGLNASGRSPYAATRDRFAALGLSQIPETGPLSWSVPGCVDGWEQLRVRFGTLPLAALLAPAIDYAEGGFAVTEIIGAAWHDAESLLAATPEAARTFLVDGRAPRVGEITTNRALATTYRRIADGGADVFYRGEIAERIVAYGCAAGAWLGRRDFADHASTWVEPISTNYRGYDVWELPPPGQGLAALEMLNILEGCDVRAMGHNTADFLHDFVEAKKLAFADRAAFCADPDAEPGLPIDELLSKAYAERQRARVDPQHAAVDVPPGLPWPPHGDTVYLAVADGAGNAVSLIQSIYYAWGSGLAAGDLGFAMQNRGTLFALDPRHPNRLEPHKRPFHTIIPAFVTRHGRPWLCFGVMGGDMQPQGHVQILCNLIDHGLNVQAAGDAARCRHHGSSTPTGYVMRDGGVVAVESGIDDETVAELRRRGHRVERQRGAFGGYQAILIDAERGVLHGASDPRKDGAAIGY